MSKLIVLLILVLIVLGCQPVPGPRPTPTIEPTATQPATPVPPSTLTPEPSVTRSPSLEPTETNTSVPTATTEPTETPMPQPITFIGAGDIGMCDSDRDENTAAIIDQYPDATVFTVGDNVYGDGTAAEFMNCYGPSWGRFKDRTRPSLGNHDYLTDNAAPYFAYFGEVVGEPGKGYYSYDLGDWHIIVLNSNCDDIGCKAGSGQEQWLRADLAANTKQCTLAYWHHPRFSSGKTGSLGSSSFFWHALYEFGAEVVVNGHDHNYERFAPQAPDGSLDPNGIREFIIGTGGATQREMGQILPNSEIHQTGTYGVIKFLLYPDHYEWEFLPAAGGTFTDTGSGTCH